MEDGIIGIKIGKGEIKGFYINAGLLYVYERMFQKQKDIIEKGHHKIEEGIKLILYGCLYLEAFCNTLVENALFYKVKNRRVAVSVWKAVQNLKIYDKINLLVDSLSQHKKNSKTYQRKIEKLFSLRNKLVHYKNQDIEVELSTSLRTKKFDTKEVLKQVVDILTTNEDHELIKKLKDAELRKCMKDIRDIDEWFKALSNNFLISEVSDFRNKEKPCS